MEHYFGTEARAIFTRKPNHFTADKRQNAKKKLLKTPKPKLKTQTRNPINVANIYQVIKH